MPQTISPAGILLGHGCYIFTGEGDPNSRTDELLTATSTAGVDSVSLASIYLDRSTGNVYVKTGANDPVSAPSGTWTSR